MWRKFSIRTRILVLLLLIVLSTIFTGGTFWAGLIQLSAEGTGETRAAIMEGFERTLKFSVQSVATRVADAVGEAKAAGTAPEKAVQRELRNIRFDRNGYYFAYDTSGVNVAHPLRPEFQGTDRINIQDKKGKPYIRQLAEKARQGGGFVTYWFFKPGEKVPSPKLAYAELIPGTDFWVATGIYIDAIDKCSAATADKFNTFTNKLVFWIAMAVILGLVLVVIPLVLFIARSITQPLSRCVDAARAIAKGRLDVHLEDNHKDEVSQLTRAMNRMADHIRDVVQNVQEGSDAVVSNGEELAASSQNLAAGASRQAASAEQISASMEQMTANITQNAETASQTEITARQAADEAEKGGKAVTETVEAMKKIAERIAIVEEIARQTNLLALNAAIEAARAGEQGKGFAVVAAEVRKLAERSGTAAGEISELSATSMQIAERAGSMLVDVVPDIKSTAELVHAISRATAEQSSGADEINRALQEFDQVVQQNAAAAEEVASTSDRLSSQALQLQDSVGFFKLNGNGHALSAPTQERQALPSSHPRQVFPVPIRDEQDVYERF